MVVARARQTMRWGLRHALLQRAVSTRLKHGDVTARLMVEQPLIDAPFEAYDRVRETAKVVDDTIVLTTAHHDVTTAVLRSPDFSVIGGPSGRAPAWLQLVAKAAGRGPTGPVEHPSMLTVDAPDHTRYRKLVTRAFTARAVAALRSRTEEIAVELLDQMAAKGRSSDLVEDYASLLPATVIAEMLGAPVDMRRQFLAWGAGAAVSLDAGLTLAQFRQSEEDLAALERWMLGHFDVVRRNPGDNILSALVRARDEEGGLSDDELLSIAILLLGAGFETTVNLIGNGVALLVEHPEQLAVLQAQPERWTNAVDEILRFESPVQRTGRIAVRDTEAAGVGFRAGQAIVILLGGANRDPAVFTDPNRFDVTRQNASDHVAFSSGIHYCLGAGLARMEGEVGLRALFERFPELQLAGPPHRRPTRVLRGYDAMPATLTPAAAKAPQHA